MPTWLSAEARREWRRVSSELIRLKVMSRTDGTALALYCQTFGDYLGYCATLAEEGAFIRTPGGCPVQHPALGAKHTALKIMNQYLQQFGLTPASRTRISAAQEIDDTPDKTRAYLFGSSS
jgi:P27 family predicted phage terminase small subunit